MGLPSSVREVVLADPAPEWVRVSDPEGVRVLPTFVGQDGRARARVRCTRAGEYAIRRLNGDDDAFLDRWRLPADVPSPAPLLHRAGRRLVDEDDEAFLWLADTWWFALCDRVGESELAELARLRREQGFTVVQLVAGLFPEVEPYEDLGELAGVWPWTPDFGDIEPRWWDAADDRLTTIVQSGLTPAVVGAWSYYLLDMGRERVLRHWREVIARWSAFPLVWCVAGEAGLPHYAQLDEPGLPELVGRLNTGWREIATEVARMDGYANVRTVHPCPAFAQFSSADAIGSADGLDLVWLQTGHADRSSIADSLAALERELAADHGLPVINSEVCYEGIAGGSSATLQRFLFFSHLLSGAAGHTYGAQGLWAFRRPQDRGPGIMWGDASWSEASALPGSAQLGRAASFLRERDWSALVPAQDALSITASADCRVLPYAAWLGPELVAYFPAVSLLPADRGISQALRDVSFVGLSAGRWRVTHWNPRHPDLTTGDATVGFEAEVGADGRLPLRHSTRRSAVPSMEDWVITVAPSSAP